MELSAELKAAFDAHATDGFNFWKDNSTPEQRAVGAAELDRFATDEEFKNGMTAFMATAFAEADADNDGLLNAAEYAVFLKRVQNDGASRGNFEDDRPETPAAQWALLNQITPGAEGITMSDFFVGVGTMMALNMEMKAAAGL